MTNGRVQCWGRNDFGQIGDGTSGVHRYSPVDVLGIDDAVRIAAGVWHVCAVLSGGTIECWGENGLGTLGTGDAVSRAIPTLVHGIDGTDLVAAGVAATATHTCVILEGGSIWCFGSNAFGQLGSGSVEESLVPVQAHAPMTALAIAVGGGFTCALVSSDSVQCWGKGSDGELGNGAFEGSEAPVDVALPLGVSVESVASEYNHACILSVEGQIWCWGANAHGQLGNGTVDPSSIPTEIAPPVPD
jgi:alpha-tubulin suppressor-like RCC1 family protein